jgi:histidinol phosphatase-like PHP family hydrolase
MTDIPNYDIHTHTVHCGHAAEDATVANMAAQAVTAGLATYGFSEHCLRSEHEQWINLIRDEMRELPPGPTRFLLGVELDADPIAADGSFVAWPEVDYVIMALHFLPGGLGHWEFDRDAHSPDERAEIGRRWLDWYAATVDRGGFEILAHPLREPISLGLLDLRERPTFDRAVAILEAAAAKHMAFELNNGWCQGVADLGQRDAFMALAREARAVGMRFSRGSDAHAIEHVGGCGAIGGLAADLALTAADWVSVDDVLALHQANESARAAACAVLQ